MVPSNDNKKTGPAVRVIHLFAFKDALGGINSSCSYVYTAFHLQNVDGEMLRRNIPNFLIINCT